MSSYDLLVKAQAEEYAWRKEMLEIMEEMRQTLKTMNRRMRRETRERKARERAGLEYMKQHAARFTEDMTQPVNLPH